MLGNKGACERRVARHAQAGACERRLDPVNYLVACCGAIAVTQHNFGRGRSRACDRLDRLVRHRMAVDQYRFTKVEAAFIQKPLQPVVIRTPPGADAVLRFAHGQFAGINRASARHHAGNDPQPRGDTWIVGGRDRTGDQGRVKFVRGAIEVDKGPRCQRDKCGAPNRGAAA